MQGRISWPDSTAIPTATCHILHTAYAIDKARASGATDAAIAQTTQEMATMKTLYDQPLFNVAFTFIEPFPIGVLVTLVSAAVLRRRVTA